MTRGVAIDAVGRETESRRLSQSLRPSARVEPDDAPASPDDVELRLLVGAARAGNAPAIRKLLHSIAPTMRAVVRRALGAGHPEEEDLLQDAFVGLLRALDTFRGECTVRHYARRIAVLRILEDRKRRRTVKRTLDERPELAAASVQELRNGSGETAEVVAVRGRWRLLFQELLAELPDAQSEAFALRHLLDYSVDEIAAATATPANTVRSRLRLAKEALRSRIADDSRWSELDPGET
jgi:RNA polymerase sigma-70 factor, ECF subfamily